MAEKGKAHWGRQIFLWITNFALTIAGIACLAHGVLALWIREDATLAITGLTAGLVFLLAASIERFEVLKGLGMEARTRKLDEAISQANATIDQLRELAELSSESVISLSSKTGRWDSALTPEQSCAIAQRVRQNLQNLGSKAEIIRHTLEPWVKTTLFDQTHRLLTEILKPLIAAQQQLNTELQSYPVPIAAGDPRYQDLLDRRDRFGGFEKLNVGEVHTWPIGTHGKMLAHLIATMPLLDESERPKLHALVSPWLPRFDYLATNYDLSEKEAWFSAAENA